MPEGATKGPRAQGGPEVRQHPAWRDVVLRRCHPGVLEKAVLSPEARGKQHREGWA